jgi:putative Mg2+ transporter-C (MgtC) family protein
MISSKEIIIRLLIATALDALVGLERERKDWAAGLRMNGIRQVSYTGKR